MLVGMALSAFVRRSLTFDSASVTLLDCHAHGCTMSWCRIQHLKLPKYTTTRW
jgi:hypothetical protein